MKSQYAAAILQARRTQMLFSVLRSTPKEDSLELIIGTTPNRQEKLATRFDKWGKVTKYFDKIPYFCARCGQNEAYVVSGVICKGWNFRKDELRGLRSVELANIITLPKPTATKARLRKQNLWNLEAIGAYDAMEKSSGRGIKVGIIDTGVNYLHEEIKHCFGAGKGHDFVDNDDDPMDENGHGTHVAGIVAGVNCGVAGGVSMYSLRVLDQNGEGSEADAIAAVEWAVKNGLDIVNCSFGMPVASSAFEDMCNYASGTGLQIVAAAGNNGGEVAMYPAAFGESVIGVAAIDRNKRRAPFSNVWPTNDIAAPGTEILSAYLDDYAVLEGTSMAAPHVTGTLALARAYYGGYINECLMQETAEKLLPDQNYDSEEAFGAGLVRADKFLEGVDTQKKKHDEIDWGVSKIEKLASFVRKVVWE